MRLSLRKQQAVWGYVFVAPWILGLALLFAWPLGRSLLLSFQRITDMFDLKTEWAGLVNYREALVEDVRFVPALLTTLQDLAINLPMVIVFSLGMATLLARIRRGQGFMRGVFFLPVVIGSAAVIQQLMGAGGGGALLGGSLQTLVTGLGASAGEGQGFLAPLQVVVSRLTLIIWHTGVQILFFIAGLNSIPPSMYEAAQVDGATAWESFWKITLPLLSPIILLAAIYTLVDSFTDPLNAVVSYIFEVTINLNAGVFTSSGLRLTYGAALGWLYFVPVFVLIVLLQRLSRGLVFYSGERQ